jgi:predicted NACHT family NTPase
LVITGGPGTGKTTLAVQLVRELLARPEPDESIPVLFSLTSWNPDAQPRIQEWLAAQLEECYPALRAFGSDVAAALTEQGRILPVLGGLT